jgi:hypothetical protein
MPKIRQAIAVLAAAAFCIGFNTFRYPVMREMAEAVSPPAQSAEPKGAEKTAAADKRPDAASPTDTPAPKPPPGVVCKDGVCTMALPDSPSASLSSSFPKDAAAPSPVQAEEKPASPAEWAKGTDSTANPSDQAESKAKDEAANSDFNVPTAEAAKPDAWTNPDPSTPPTDGPEGKFSNKTAAKLVSASGMSSSPPSDPETTLAAQAVLIPIQRPKSRFKETGAAADRQPSDSKPEAGQEPSAKTVRHLPPVDQVSSAETPDLTPDLVSTYPVTPAK